MSGLRDGSPVEIYGIDAGIVEKLSIDEDKSMAVVEMKLKKGMKVYDDGSAAIKTSGLIGDKLIKIDPGGGRRCTQTRQLDHGYIRAAGYRRSYRKICIRRCLQKAGCGPNLAIK